MYLFFQMCQEGQAGLLATARSCGSGGVASVCLEGALPGNGGRRPMAKGAPRRAVSPLRRPAVRGVLRGAAAPLRGYPHS